MTLRSANKRGNLISTSILWMTGFFLVASALCGAHAEQRDPAKATTFGYVVNTNDNTVSVIDTVRNAVVATIPVGFVPEGVATTPAGTRAYVTNFGDDTVSVIDTASNKVVATIPVGVGPDGIAITPDGNHGYVANLLDNTVSVIDTAKNTMVATIPVGETPIAIAITPDGTRSPEHDDRRRRPRAYVTNAVDDTVSVIDTASNTVVATIPVGLSPEGVATTPDGTHVYVADRFDNSVSVIDTAKNTVVDTIPVGAGPEGIAITPDGTQGYETNSIDNTVSVIDTASNAVVDTIPAGRVPLGVGITPNGTRPYEHDDRPHHPLAYVTNFCGIISCTASDFTVSVIDIASNAVVATIPVGQDPAAVAFATVTPSHRNNEQ